MVRALLLTASLVACGGPVEQTLVDELRVVAAIPSTPEARPGEIVDVSVTIIEPTGADVDVLVWLCTPSGPPGSPCLEEAGSQANAVAVAKGVPGDVQVSLEVSPLLAGALSDAVPEVPVALWVLTCEPDLCPIMDQVEATPSLGVPADVAGHLADPTSLLTTLPLQGVAASRRTLVVSSRTDDTRNRNPELFGAFVASPVEPGQEVLFSLDVSDDQPGGDAFGYATAGGFGAASVPVLDGRVDLAWFAPEEATETPIELLVVAQDGLGGEALWRSTVEMTPVR